MTTTIHSTNSKLSLQKCPTGILGLDEVTFAGFLLNAHQLSAVQ